MSPRSASTPGSRCRPSRRSSTARSGRSGVAAPNARLARLAGCRVDHDGGDAQWVAVQRDALGPPRVRCGGHAGEPRSPTSASTASPSWSPASASCSPRSWPTGDDRLAAAAGWSSLVAAVMVSPTFVPWTLPPTGRPRSPPSRATCRAAATTCSTTRAADPEPRRGHGGWPTGSLPARPRGPTSWSGRRTPRPSTRSPTPAINAGIEPRSTRSACRAGRGIVDAGEATCSTRASCGTPRPGRETATSSSTPSPYGEYIPLRGDAGGPTAGRLEEVGARHAPPATGPASMRAAECGGDVICFKVAYDGGSARQSAHGAQVLVVQTSNARVRCHRTGRAAVRDDPAASDGDRPVAGRGLDQRDQGVISRDGTVVRGHRGGAPRMLIERIDLGSRGSCPGCRRAGDLGLLRRPGPADLGRRRSAAIRGGSDAARTERD